METFQKVISQEQEDSVSWRSGLRWEEPRLHGVSVEPIKYQTAAPLLIRRARAILAILSLRAFPVVLRVEIVRSYNEVLGLRRTECDAAWGKVECERGD